MNRPRVLLADDHKIVVEGLRILLESEFELVGTVEDGRTLLAEARRLRPDVIVLDVSMPLLNGIDAAEQLKKTDPWIKIIFLTMYPDVTYATRAFEAGASGYVLKHAAPSELVTAIRESLLDRTYVTPMIANDVLQSMMSGSKQKERVDFRLTSRQREILQLVAEGRSAKQISSVLNISPRTVEFHKYRIMDSLNLHSQTEMIQYAIRHGLTAV